MGWTLPSGYRHPIGLTHLAALATERALASHTSTRGQPAGPPTCAAIDSVLSSVLACEIPLESSAGAQRLLRRLQDFRPSRGLSPDAVRGLTLHAMAQILNVWPISPPSAYSRTAMRAQFIHFSGSPTFFQSHVDGYSRGQRVLVATLDMYVQPARMVAAVTEGGAG